MVLKEMSVDEREPICNTPRVAGNSVKDLIEIGVGLILFHMHFTSTEPVSQICGLTLASKDNEAMSQICKV